jgi:hypothetical protein
MSGTQNVNEHSFLRAFHNVQGRHVLISPDQGSRFAKDIAGDFNPIHDADSRRFCVPGDLLFALVLARYGVSACMHCRFVGMVGAVWNSCFRMIPARASRGRHPGQALPRGRA